jgi:hypothetical protein
MRSLLKYAPVFIFFLGSGLNGYSSPDGHPCVPLLADVAWERTASYKLSFDKMKDLIDNNLKKIPGVPKASIETSLQFQAFHKKGCCSETSDSHTELRRGRIAGVVSAGVKTGPLPIPGLSLPAGVGGVYVRASTDVSITLSGESTQVCNSNYNKLCATGTLSGNVSIGGGVNVWGDFIYGEVRGTGSFSGSGSWCEGEDPKLNNACGHVSANLIFGGFFGETVINIFQANECV